MIKTDLNSGSASFNSISDIIDACRKGDHKAQLKIYKLYYKPIYSNCLKLANEPDVAEDLMHESFLSAFENINTYNSNSSFYSWLNSFIPKNN